MAYFWDQFNMSQTQPNPALLTPLSADTCKTCSAFVAASTQLQEQHQHYVEAPFDVKSVLTESLLDNVANVTTDVDQRPSKIVNAQGATIATATAKRQQLTATLKWDNGWKVHEVQVVT